MKAIWESWENYLGLAHLDSISSVVDYLETNGPQEVEIDSPKGTMKFKRELPFDYGEWVSLINPIDNMGWDIVVTPSATSYEDLLPVGHLIYNELSPHKLGNDKIIVAPNGTYESSDRQTIDDFFAEVPYFEDPVWYGG